MVSSLHPLFVRLGWLFAVAMSLIAVVYPTFDWDLYWHLANGREIWNQGRIVQQDVYSFTQAGTSYSNTEWLSQLIFYGLWSVGGLLALFLFKLIVTISVVQLCWSTLRAIEVQTTLVAATLIPLAVLAGFYRFIERPELFSLLGVAVTVALIICTREDRWPRRLLYLLPFIMLVWEWLHGAIFGMTLLAAAVFAENLSFHLLRGRQGDVSPEWLRTLNRAALATLLLSLLNPYGLLNYGIFASVVTNAGGFSSVVEWAPADLRNYWLYFTLFALAVAGSLWRSPLNRPTEWLWMFGFGILAWRYSRMTGVFALAALPWLVFALGNLKTERLRQIASMLLLLLLVVALYLLKFSPWAFSERRFGWYASEDFLPVGSARFALEQGLQGPLFNTGHFGGYLAFKLYPSHKIFHYNLPKVWGETYRDDPMLPERYAIEWAIVGRMEALKLMFPQERWAYLFLDNGGVLVARRGGVNARLVERFEVRYFRPNMAPERLAALLGSPRQGARLAFETSVYCAYRDDPKLCRPLYRHLVRRADPYAWQAEWLPRIEARQAASLEGESG